MQRKQTYIPPSPHLHIQHIHQPAVIVIDDQRFQGGVVVVMKDAGTEMIGKELNVKDNGVNNKELIAVNKSVRNASMEAVGAKLRGYMSAMK